ncbi:MAG TPA: polysaccharide deacetylase family protein [Pyrinomonadaceae bacterium]|nr:polysaccharide deacetylase family protein [Pyrinomonadaceae bacterium]
MLKKLKQTTLASLKGSGAFKLVENSRWRRQRLLILAYHGISMDDEHLWNPAQYISQELFRDRLNLIAESGCTVLPLAEAVRRLYARDLPERSIVLTFDDGTYDFYLRAYPLLKEFNYPATLYLTTFYSQYNRPVFDVCCSYLLWKGRERNLDLSGLVGQDVNFNLSSERERTTAFEKIKRFSHEQKLSAADKDELLATIARKLGVDYDNLVSRRLLQLISPAEVKSLAADGIDVQLHTHRHRTPTDRELFLKEIEDNRNFITEITGASPSHFCYPSGNWSRTFLPWLSEAGIESATTCEIGLATPQSHPLLLPRLVDVSGLSPIEFEGWVTGISTALPRRQ